MLNPWHLKHAIGELRSWEEKLPTPELRLSLPFLYKSWGYFNHMLPCQNHNELSRFYLKLLDFRPKNLLEIGTAAGGTLYLWGQAATDDAKMVSLDLDTGGGYRKCRADLYTSFARDKQQIHLIRDDSHSQTALDRVKSLFADEPIDFLFIDGDHTYEGVKMDFDMYSPLVRPGGIVAFHDICPHPDLPVCQVDAYWNDIKSQYNHEEIIGTSDEFERLGIGVIYM